MSDSQLHESNDRNDETFQITSVQHRGNKNPNLFHLFLGQGPAPLQAQT